MEIDFFEEFRFVLTYSSVVFVHLKAGLISDIDKAPKWMKDETMHHLEDEEPDAHLGWQTP